VREGFVDVGSRGEYSDGLGHCGCSMRRCVDDCLCVDVPNLSAYI
jgi:hypothetical protein